MRLTLSFPTEIKKISGLDALFIRARTDSMNISYVAARIAELKGIPVIDDPNSIRICSDKINMYLHLMKKEVPMPKTIFMKKGEITLGNLEEVFKIFNPPMILKEPSTSFSARVERVYTKKIPKSIKKDLLNSRIGLWSRSILIVNLIGGLGS